MPGLSRLRTNKYSLLLTPRVHGSVITYIGCISGGVIGYILDSSRSSQFSRVGLWREKARGGKEAHGPCGWQHFFLRWESERLQAVTGLGLMLSTTAEMTAPAALAPSISACSTCKADRFTGLSGVTPGLCPALPLPHHSPSATGLPGGGSHLC